MVNHELEFVDDDGNHTNNIEATWGASSARSAPASARKRFFNLTFSSRCGVISTVGQPGMPSSTLYG